MSEQDPTITTITTIKLIDGVDLVVHRDRIEGEISERQIERIRELLDVRAQRAAIDRIVDQLVESNAGVESITPIVDATGWISNRTDRTAIDLAVGVLALLETLDGERLMDVREAAELEMHKLWGRERGDDDDQDDDDQEPELAARWDDVGRRLKARSPEAFGKAVALFRAFTASDGSPIAEAALVAGLDGLFGAAAGGRAA